MGWRAPGCPAAWEGDGSDPLWGHQHRGLLAPALTLTFAAVSCPPCPTCSQAEGAGVLGDVQAAAWERRGSAETHPPPRRGLLWWAAAISRDHGLIVTSLLSPQDPNWYKAKNKVGREGIIPANYVQKREGVKAGIKLSLMP